MLTGFHFLHVVNALRVSPHKKKCVRNMAEDFCKRLECSRLGPSMALVKILFKKKDINVSFMWRIAVGV